MITSKAVHGLFRNLVDSVAKGGNFMVGIGPDGDGRFSPVALDQLSEVGDWLKVNGEAIYATRPRPGELWKEGAPLTAGVSGTKSAQPPDFSGENPPIRFSRTKDNRTLYAICLGWPGKPPAIEDGSASRRTRDKHARTNAVAQEPQ